MAEHCYFQRHVHQEQSQQSSAPLTSYGTHFSFPAGSTLTSLYLAGSHFNYVTGNALQSAGARAEESYSIDVLEKHRSKNAASIANKLPDPRLMAGIRHALERGISDDELVRRLVCYSRMQYQ